jgi:hypothetical protein
MFCYKLFLFFNNNRLLQVMILSLLWYIWLWFMIYVTLLKRALCVSYKIALKQRNLFLPYVHVYTRERYSFFLHYLQQPIDDIDDINLLLNPDQPNVFQGAEQTLYQKQKKYRERIVYDTCSFETYKLVKHAIKYNKHNTRTYQ